jgi:beta-lactamase class D
LLSEVEQMKTYNSHVESLALQSIADKYPSVRSFGFRILANGGNMQVIKHIKPRLLSKNESTRKEAEKCMKAIQQGDPNSFFEKPSIWKRWLKFGFYALFICPFLLSCDKTPSHPESAPDQNDRSNLMESRMAFLMDSMELRGSVMFYRLGDEKYFGYNKNRWDSAFLPASTFKIVNTLIGLETGVLPDSSHIFKWDGAPRDMSQWDSDLSLRQALKVSCVPCFQELARNIGTDRMNQYLSKLDYGHMSVDTATIDKFWLEGNSRISSREQMNFIHHLYAEDLPVKKECIRKTKDLLFIHDNDSYKIYGKTGWSIRDGFNVGWFVGWFTSDDQTILVVSNVEPKDPNHSEPIMKGRLGVSLAIAKELKLLPSSIY